MKEITLLIIGAFLGWLINWLNSKRLYALKYRKVMNQIYTICQMEYNHIGLLEKAEKNNNEDAINKYTREFQSTYLSDLVFKNIDYFDYTLLRKLLEVVKFRSYLDKSESINMNHYILLVAYIGVNTEIALKLKGDKIEEVKNVIEKNIGLFKSVNKEFNDKIATDLLKKLEDLNNKVSN